MSLIEPDHFSLTELVARWGQSIGYILRYGSEEKLTISAVADGWLVEGVQNSDRPESTKGIEVRDWVTLDPEDIRVCIDKDHVVVHHIKLNDEKNGKLKIPINIQTGNLYVSIEERNRFEKEHQLGPFAPDYLADRNQAPYLDTNHKYHSKEIAAGIHAWMALCLEGNFTSKSSPKSQIEDWLRKNTEGFSSEAINRISTMANPRKEGGSPKTE